MKVKKSISYRVFLILNGLFFILCAFVMIYPYLNTLAKSLSASSEVAKGGITMFPRGFTWDNYRAMLGDVKVFRALGVSVLRTVVGTVTSVLCTFMAAYAMHKKDVPFRTPLIMFLMLIGYINPGMIPTYVNFSNLKLLNTFWIYILPTMFNFYNAIVMRTFIDATIPDSLFDAGYIDGADDLQMFYKVVIPLSKPVLATVSLWQMVGHWNDWTTTLYYVRNSKWHTMQYKMMQLVKESEYIAAKIKELQMLGIDAGEAPASTPDTLIAAQVILTTLPIVMVYPFLQKYFVKGFMVGSVKG